MKLFRAEAVRATERRIEGEVSLAVPLTTRLMTLVLTGCVLAAAVGASLFRYARREVVIDDGFEPQSDLPTTAILPFPQEVGFDLVRP